MRIKITLNAHAKTRIFLIDQYQLILEETKKNACQLRINEILTQLEANSTKVRAQIVGLETENSELNTLILRDAAWPHTNAPREATLAKNRDRIKILEKELEDARNKAYATSMPIGDSQQPLSTFLLIKKHQLKEEDILIGNTDLNDKEEISDTISEKLQNPTLIQALNESLRKLREANAACDKLIKETEKDTEEHKLLEKIQFDLTDRDLSPKERLINTNKTLDQASLDGPSSYARIIIEAIKKILNGRFFHFTLFKDKIDNYKDEINKDIQNKP